VKEKKIGHFYTKTGGTSGTIVAVHVMEVTDEEIMSMYLFSKERGFALLQYGFPSVSVLQTHLSISHFSHGLFPQA